MKYIAYIDGSYKKDERGKEAYGSAFVIAPEGSSEWTTFSQASNDEYAVHHNIAGELFACMLVCDYAMKLPDCTDLLIIHDLEGTANWIVKGWKHNNKLTQMYYAYMMGTVWPKLKVHFQWTKGHAKSAGNNLVDEMSRNAVLKYLREH